MPLRAGILATLMASAYLAGCQSDIGLSTTFDPLTPFPRQAIFAWNERANSLPDNEQFRSLDLDPLLREVVEEEMAARGYREGSAASANYRLSYEVGVTTWHGPEGSSSVGSLSLELTEARSRRRVWVGFARAEIFVGLTGAERKERLHGIVARMLEKFPPTQRGD